MRFPSDKDMLLETFMAGITALEVMELLQQLLQWVNC